jgi:hypothetical protein
MHVMYKSGLDERVFLAISNERETTMMMREVFVLGWDSIQQIPLMYRLLYILFEH